LIVLDDNIYDESMYHGTCVVLSVIVYILASQQETIKWNNECPGLSTFKIS